MPAPVTRKQFSVLQAIRLHQRSAGLSPTLEELGQALQVNRITAYGHVQALLEKGYLSNRARGASRALELTEAGRTLLSSLEAEHRQPVLPFPAAAAAVHDAGGGASDRPSTPPAPSPAAAEGAPARRIPLLGRIAAGVPLEAVEDREEKTLDDLLPAHGELYLLQVQGESMIEDHIQDGDWVLVRRDAEPRDGDIVVAVLEDGEATLKRFYREKGGIRLQPANHAMAPLFVERLDVRGVVAGVVRRYG
ncbi:MAG: transcriptional repressor LexA [Planctomycetota bacterium]|nr:MAG: transcriptional repressor LexA [Planctomycetota bacterium]